MQVYLWTYFLCLWTGTTYHTKWVSFFIQMLCIIIYIFLHLISNETKINQRAEMKKKKKKFSGDQQKLCVVGKIYTESERYEMFTRKQIIKTAKEKFNSLCCRHFSCWPRNKGSEITGKKNLFNKIYNVETPFRATKIFSCIYEIITH